MEWDGAQNQDDSRQQMTQDAEWSVLAARFRMTPSLIKWFMSNAVKTVKLGSGTSASPPTEVELKEFDSWLWEPWPKKSIPAGIREELRREARGYCLNCNVGTATLKAAHIRRKHCYQNGVITRRYE